MPFVFYDIEPIRLNTIMLDTSCLQAACAEASAARRFQAPYSVTLPLDAALPEDEWMIDLASTWARSPDRRGRSRRIVHAADRRVVFEFDDVVDAVECHLRFY